MKMRRFLLSLFAALVLAAAPVQAQEALNAKQADQVRKIVKDYLMENPEVILDAVEALREKQRLAAEAEAKRAITERKKDIFEDPTSPVSGNPKGDVVLVEFFDYNCVYCKTMHDSVMKMVKEDGKVRLIYKELPILGPASLVAAKAALAAGKQKKYAEFQDALMRLKGSLSETSIMKTAADVGLDTTKLKKDMEGADVADAIARNKELARALNIEGTPAFVIGETVLPGAIPEASLKQWINDQRENKNRKKG
jgi:protein-disulfide isomerase